MKITELAFMHIREDSMPRYRFNMRHVYTYIPVFGEGNDFSNLFKVNPLMNVKYLVTKVKEYNETDT